MDAVEHPLRIHIIVPGGESAQWQSQNVRLNIGQSKIVRAYKLNLLCSHFQQNGKGIRADIVYIFADNQCKIAYLTGVRVGRSSVLRIPYQFTESAAPGKRIAADTGHAVRDRHRRQNAASRKCMASDAGHAVFHDNVGDIVF